MPGAAAAAPFAAPHSLTPSPTVPAAQVPAGSSASYPLSYAPLTMTTANALHEGSAFFPLPDGSGLLYKLSGEVRWEGGTRGAGNWKATETCCLLFL
jgi:hypothetical protein